MQPGGPTSNDLHEFWASHRQEGHLGLRGHCLGQQRLPAAGGAKQQRTLRDLGTKLKEALRALGEQQNVQADLWAPENHPGTTLGRLGSYTGPVHAA